VERVRISGKNENITFFSIGHLGHIYFVFIGPSHFFIGKTDKTDSYQELWDDS
jgi:hypothetical protein